MGRAPDVAAVTPTGTLSAPLWGALAVATSKPPFPLPLLLLLPLPLVAPKPGAVSLQLVAPLPTRPSLPLPSGLVPWQALISQRTWRAAAHRRVGVRAASQGVRARTGPSGSSKAGGRRRKACWKAVHSWWNLSTSSIAGAMGKDGGGA